MSDIREIARRKNGRSTFRQTHQNADGREVYLYSHSNKLRSPSGAALNREAQSSELRWHPLRQEWNVYAAARQNRTYKPGAAADPLAPMIAGGPATEVPFEDFDVAVFENRFPAFSASTKTVSHPHVRTEPAEGACEVVVYCPDAEGSLGTLSDARRALLVEAWIDRYKAHFESGLEYVLPFENRGDEVGVTLHHPHGQIYAFDRTPEPQAKALAAFRDGFDLAADLERWRTDYWVAEAGGVVQFAPPFARFPYETWIASRRRRRGPWEFDDEEIESFSHLLGAATRRYDAFFNRPTPYMLTLQAAPRTAGAAYQFTAQFYPILRSPDRLKFLASVEQATGIFTVDVVPETAAAALRSVSDE